MGAKMGGISKLYFRGVDDNLLDASGGEQLNQYRFSLGSNLADLQSNGAASITVEENGPLVATLVSSPTRPGAISWSAKFALLREPITSSSPTLWTKSERPSSARCVCITPKIVQAGLCVPFFAGEFVAARRTNSWSRRGTGKLRRTYNAAGRS